MDIKISEAITLIKAGQRALTLINFELKCSLALNLDSFFDKGALTLWLVKDPGGLTSPKTKHMK